MLMLFRLFLISTLVDIYHNAEFTDTWAVHVEGGEDRAKRMAEKHGYTYLGQIMPDYYHLQHHHVAKRSAYPSPHHEKTLSEDPEILWFEQQKVKSRVKRDLHRRNDVYFNDPKWSKMWYLNRGKGLDMNVEDAWSQGATGMNIVVSILDDGIEKDHPDLLKNYDPKASYDVNGRDPDPQPRYDMSNENRHGTRCAGEVAAEANNNICSVGVAYHSKIGGVRMLDGDVTDAVEAQSLSLNPQHIDIYSASWGPDDDGRTVDGPATLAKKAFKDGIKQGRDGKGSIFVWASGNGGRDYDSCNCDGYTNSIYTLSISSATEHGGIPWYSEACSSTLATTYSSGAGSERQIVTTDLRKGCTEYHTGTSASAPLAAGICALALSANPSLTWRDMQHIVVMTARPTQLKANDWVLNGVGRKVSHSFGFGLMDAGAMVRLAKNWTNVPEQHKCEILSGDGPKSIAINGKVTVHIESNGCAESFNTHVLFVEHAQAVIKLSASRRGNAELYLTSPAGTRSTLLAKRPRDGSQVGLNDWAFMTVHNWGELSVGTWTLEVHNEATSSTLEHWSLVLYGTATDPTIGQMVSHPIPHPPVNCTSGQYALGTKCLHLCPTGYYAANLSLPINRSDANSAFHTAGVCYVCSANCAVCDGFGLCTACKTDFLLTAERTCTLESEDGSFANWKYKYTFLAAMLCVGSVALFVVLFAMLQLKDHGMCPNCQSGTDVEKSPLTNGSEMNGKLNGKVKYKPVNKDQVDIEEENLLSESETESESE